MKATAVRTLIGCLTAMGFVMVNVSIWAQQSPPNAAGAGGNAFPKIITNVYPVADLVFSAPNYPFRGIAVPGAAEHPPADGSGSGGGIGGFGGGGFGGGGGGLGGGGGGHGGFGGGGGGFNVTPETGPALLPRRGGGAFSVADGGNAAISSIEKLAQAIQNSIGPGTWSGAGGIGTIVPLGDRLIISQTKDVHDAIKDLLSALRASGGARSTVTVRAWWLKLDMSQYQRLLTDMPASSPPKVNRTQLEQLAADRAADYAEITCFDGQTVHVISGRFRNAITSVIPVVGQAEPPLSAESEVQLAASDSHGSSKFMFTVFDDGTRTNHKDHCGSESLLAMAGDATGGGEAPAKLSGSPTNEGVVGYQPVFTTQHAGAMLEITPTRLPDSKTIVLDLRSIVNRWDDKPETPVEFRNVVRLDRTNVVSQQLGTTLKLPVRQPVLAGGMSLEPGADVNGKSQLYLVVEAVDESK
jgi:hypothetical protein